MANNWNGWINTHFRLRESSKTKPTLRRSASIFLDELLRNGTTTVLQPFILSLLMLFLRKQAVVTYAWFLEGNDGPKRSDFFRYTWNVLSGKQATDSKVAQKGVTLCSDSWFAITSTDEQLRLAGKLLAEFQMFIYIRICRKISMRLSSLTFSKQQGLSRCLWSAGLVRDKSVFAHGVQLTDVEFKGYQKRTLQLHFAQLQTCSGKWTA